MLDIRRPATVVRAVILAMLLSSCGGDSGTSTTNGIPVLLSVNPAQLVSGAAGATVTLTGEAFSSGARARWNDADRPTRYQSATTITVDLAAADLAIPATGRLTVVNPAPGGGTSGVLTLAIGLPKPTLTSISPNVVNAGASSVVLTLLGTGFTAQSFVRVNGSFVSTSYVSATEMRVTLNDFVLQSSGVLKVNVSNPTPGGGASGDLDLSVQAPVPALTGITPDSAISGVGFTLTVLGSGYTTASVVRVNGATRTTTFVNSGRLTVAVGATDVAAAGTSSITVFNAAPGGGTSAALTLRIRDRAPQITNMAPSSVVAGAGTTTLTVSGTSFTQGSTIQINGVSRTTTFVSATTLTTTLTAGDVSQPGASSVLVLNGGSSGASNTVALPVLAATMSIQTPVIVSLKHNHVVYDNLRNQFYVSVPSSVAGIGNAITIVSPSGAIGASVAVGSEPGRMAIADDGSFLYVTMGGSPTIVRVALASFSKDIEFPVGSGIFGALLAEDIEVLPGLPRVVVASRRNTCCSPRHEGVAIFDDGVMRTTTTQGHTGSDRITRSGSATILYGYNNETTEFGFRRILVSGTGLQEQTVVQGIVGGFGTDIEFDGGRVYSTSGAVIDAATMTLVGSTGASGIVRPDAGRGRVHYLSGSQLVTRNAISFTSIGSYTNVDLDSHSSLVRWGTDGLAAGGGTTLVIMRGTLVGP